MQMLTAQAFAPRHRVMSRDKNGELNVTPIEDLWPEEEWLIDSYRAIALNDGSGDMVVVPQLVSRQVAVISLAKARGMFLERIKLDVGSLTAEKESLKSALAELANTELPGQLDQPPEPPKPSGPTI
jgi:hypothetical protein